VKDLGCLGKSGLFLLSAYAVTVLVFHYAFGVELPGSFLAP